MRERLFSTAELGRLLSVSQATIKRWADTGRIGCFRTPGGHRKFRLCNIAGFVEDTGYEVSGALSGLLHDGHTDRAVEDAVWRDDLQLLTSSFRDRAVTGDVEGLQGMFSCLTTRGVCVATIFDKVVAPAFAAIGEAWENGEISILDEHLATRSTIEALDRLGEMPASRPGEERLALCACLEGERHDLGSLSVAIVLESCGFQALHVGADTPVSDVVAHLTSRPVELIAVSSKAPPDAGELNVQVRHLARAARRTSTRLILGGQGFSLLPEDTRRMLTVLDSCHELAETASRRERTA